MDEVKQKIDELRTRLDAISEALNVQHMRSELVELENRAQTKDFWNNQEEARRVMSEIAGLREDINLVVDVGKRLDDAFEVVGEHSLLSELQQTVQEVDRLLSKLETKTFLSGKYDKGAAILSIHAGQGGTEAMDWASMLLRMYLRYADKQEWNYELAEQIPGEEAGVKSVTLIINGRWTYGYLKGEAGTHRLVRQSPFNADRLRQTSFALVEVMPNIAESGEILIDEGDVEWQFFRASSQGGQNVQKVSTAVRLTHKPSGVVVTAQQERSQEQNRKIALDLLRAKLWTKQEEEKKKQQEALRGEYSPASWGTQIRSYVLHPYKMVKDLRTGVESSAPEAVLDGELDEFIEAELRIVKE